MKWTLVGLMFLGLVAAVSASVLLAGLRGEPQIIQVPADAPLEPVEVAVAARALGPLTVVDSKSVQTQIIPADQVPEGAIRGAAKVVGSVLTVSVVEGQVFTVDCFAEAGSALDLASALPEGMRAVSLSLSESAGLSGLAYPGCVVDVLVSFTIPGRKNDQQAEAISMTLLQGVEVLAIGRQTVMSVAKKKDAALDTSSRRSLHRSRLITVMVDPSQAKALQLAMKYGTLSLALRNPLDATPVNTDRTRLSSLSDEYSGLLRQIAALKNPAPTQDSRPSTAAGSVKQPVARVEAEPVSDKVTAPALWDTTIIRGQAIETRTFPWPEEDAGS